MYLNSVFGTTDRCLNYLKPKTERSLHWISLALVLFFTPSNCCTVDQVFVSTGNVCVHACGERHALWDPWPRKSQTSYTLGTAWLRRAVHFIKKVLHHLPDHSVCIRYPLIAFVLMDHLGKSPFSRFIKPKVFDADISLYCSEDEIVFASKYSSSAQKNMTTALNVLESSWNWDAAMCKINVQANIVHILFCRSAPFFHWRILCLSFVVF